MLPSVLAVVLAVGVAWWGWRGRLGAPIARVAMAARAVAVTALLLLLIDPGIATRNSDRRTLVLLDNTVSMHASGGHAADAARIAAAIGDTTSFGEIARGEPGGRSSLLDPLTGAISSGRTVAIVSDGEIADVSSIPADLLAQASVRLVPRSAGPDIAITDVQAPLRLTAGDTLTVEIDARRTADAPDTASIEVRDTAMVLLRGTVRFGRGVEAHISLSGALPRGLQGERWLRIERTGAPDAEPGDDVRWWRLRITPTPGVVVIAETPDWDSRALYRALKDVVDVPIHGYAQLQRGQWRRMDDLRTVSAAEVAAAAKGADLLAVRGNVKEWQAFGHARLLWPLATSDGDWYVGSGGVSPVSGAFAGIEPDSLPPAAGVTVLDSALARGWVGATARLARRGAVSPVIGGIESRSGRTIVIGVDGLYRWSLRGGVADQVWRTLVAGAATWLLAAPEGDSVRARVTEPVTQRGRLVHFRWVGGGTPAPLAIRLRGSRGERDDTLRFDAAGDASLAADVGRYQYVLDGGSGGTFAVEPFADELVPGPITLKEHVGAASQSVPRRSLRELIWLFAIAIAGFGTEWMLRRRLGMR